MEMISGLGMKSSLTSLSLGLKYFNSLRDESDEPIYAYEDKFMRFFVRQGIKGGRGTAFILCFESTTADKIFDSISKELNVKWNICDVIEACVKHKSKENKKIEKQYKSNFDDYRTIEEKKNRNCKKSTQQNNHSY